ncbi:MAG: hypothetical protein SVX43_22330, partial [Cyanobacteriota bacterium]|nr:hypothetical protein [Cyanobacteriota bacterium]
HYFRSPLRLFEGVEDGLRIRFAAPAGFQNGRFTDLTLERGSAFGGLCCRPYFWEGEGARSSIRVSRSRNVESGCPIARVAG